MRVEGRETHAGIARERGDLQSAGVISVDAMEDSADLTEMRVRRGQRAQVMTERAHEHSIG